MNEPKADNEEPKSAAADDDKDHYAQTEYERITPESISKAYKEFRVSSDSRIKVSKVDMGTAKKD